MRTLYDLLGARPDDNSEGLRIAFRKAMAIRPGLPAGDPDAPERFRQLVEAYEILRNAERRAIYDRLLEFERRRVYSKLRCAISCLIHNATSCRVHNIVLDALSIVGLVVVLAGGHTFFSYVSKTPADITEVTAHGPAERAGIRLDGTGMAKADQPREKLERVTVLETDHAFAARVDQDRPQSGEVQLSYQKKDRDDSKSSSSDFAKSDFAKSDDKSDIRIPDTRSFNTHDMKIPEIKITRKPRVDAKRQARNHAPVKQDSFENTQASLENIKTFTCSGPQSCSSELPVFGVGF